MSGRVTAGAGVRAAHALTRTLLAAAGAVVSEAALPGSQADLGCWTWEGGSKDIVSQAPEIPKWPTSRCCSQSWSVGNTTYMFGGAGYVPGGSTAVYLADMWKFSNGEWQLLGEASSLKPNTNGSSSVPASRNYAPTWTSENELWMWGGTGARFDGDTNGGLLTDTWKFSLSTQQWTRHNVPDPQPPARNWANFWQTPNGGVFISGGTGGPPDYGLFADLWHFSSTTKGWDKVYSYSDSSVNYNASDGPLHPGARSNSYTITTDDGDLLMFGGEGRSGNPSKSHDGDFQDIWLFSQTSSSWEHVGGPEGNRKGTPIYGSLGVYGMKNLPPAEHAGYILRSPYRGALWFLGGENGKETAGMRNDLWSLKTQSYEWAWQAGLDGYNGTAKYGTMGVPAIGNTPAARYAGQSWVANDKIWVYGGYGFDEKMTPGYLDDTWSFSLPCSHTR